MDYKDYFEYSTAQNTILRFFYLNIYLILV